MLKTKRYIKTLFYLWVFLTVCPLFAQEQNKGYAILSRALDLDKNSPNTTRTEKHKFKPNIEYEVIEKIKVTTDGRVLRRTDAVITQAGAMKDLNLDVVGIENAQGLWQLSGKKALLLKCIFEQIILTRKLDPYYYEVVSNPKNSFSTEDVNEERHDSWKVTMRLNDEEYARKLNIEKSIQEDIIPRIHGSKSNVSAKSHTILVYEFIIDRQSYDIWSKTTYNRQGDLIEKKKYSKIDHKTVIPDLIYAIPDDMEKIIINNPEELTSK